MIAIATDLRLRFCFYFDPVAFASADPMRARENDSKDHA